ncbi:MAG: CO dehydrogenase/acetyl-CoA synthase complex subunit epsilon [Deltaproteobacteria bacterium]|nr:CO dehydrogenase/acetyl-CoA synthase complex subunit epsilon [Deltaproteobacteria bacterium]
MTLPYHKVNVLTGTKEARIIKDGAEYAELIKKAERPLLVLGPRVLKDSLNGKLLLDWALELARSGNIPICATAHTKKGLLARECIPECSYDIMEILNCLKTPSWKGVKGEGNHDLVLFFGIRTDLASAGLSTLKHYAPHLKTMTLCRYYFPHADYSMPNFPKDQKWEEFLDNMLANLKEK